MTAVHAGVYVDHNGPLSWRQRAWAAVLLTAPAALAGGSALRAHGLRGHEEQQVIEVAVDRHRHLTVPRSVRLVRMTTFRDVALLHLSPPRLRLEAALLQVAGRALSEDGVVAVLADACQQRRTTPGRLVAELGAIARMPRRRLLVDVLHDVAVGAYSALERRYLRDVERAHRLPTARRQERGPGVVRDVTYLEQLVVVELDGRLGHEWADERWRDLDRDLDAAVTGVVTIRAGWRQVLDPCRLADRVGRILVARGWDGQAQPCGPACRLRG